MTVISDSCFSGTVTRAIVSKVLPGLRKTPDDRRVRFLSPALRGGTMLPNPWEAQPKRQKYAESKMREVLLSGCTDKEYSYDALIGDIYHDGMTYYALQAIRQANYQITYAQLHSRMAYLLDEAGYPQHPQMTRVAGPASRSNVRAECFASPLYPKPRSSLCVKSRYKTPLPEVLPSV